MLKQITCVFATVAIAGSLCGSVMADATTHHPNLNQGRERIHDATRQRSEDRRAYSDEMRIAQREHSDAMRLHGQARAEAMSHARSDIHAVTHQRAMAIDRTRREWHSGVHERNMYRRDEANKRHWAKEAHKDHRI